MGMSLLTLQKTPDSRMYSYWDLAWTKHKIQKVVFWPKLPKFLAKLNFDFSLHNFSRYVIFGFFANFLHERFSDKKALQTNGRTDGRTDARTDIHGGKNNIWLPQGETYNTTENDGYIKNITKYHSLFLNLNVTVLRALPFYYLHLKGASFSSFILSYLLT